MADIIFDFTDASGEKWEYPTYQVGYETLIYCSYPKNEVVRITEKDIINCTETLIVPTDNTYTFKDTKQYVYFISIEDLNGNVLVEKTRVYCYFDKPHTAVYGICGSGKCKVPVVSQVQWDNEFIPAKELNDNFRSEVRNCCRSVSVTFMDGAKPEDNWSQVVPYPSGFDNIDNIRLISQTIYLYDEYDNLEQAYTPTGSMSKACGYVVFHRDYMTLYGGTGNGTVRGKMKHVFVFERTVREDMSL